MEMIYLDCAAATPVDSSVLEAMLPYLTEKFYNPSALYMAAQSVRKEFEAARAGVAQLLGARPVEITFTAGGTEANNLAIHGVMRAFPGARMVVSAIEHDSVLETAKLYDYATAAVTEQGIIDLNSLRDVLDDNTVLVSVMLANNEIGTIQPVRQITEMVKDIRAERRKNGVELPLYVHTDAAQAVNYLDVSVARLGVDLLSLNGGKIYGPKQSGVLYIKSGTRLQPLVYGGGQEHGLRSGTENVPAAIGFARALQLTQELREAETRRLQQLQTNFFNRLNAQIPGVVINGWTKKRLPNNVHITIPGQDNERLLFALDERGIQAAAGSACSASSQEASHVLRALGLDEASARASLRFTMGRGTTQEQIAAAADALAAILA